MPPSSRNSSALIVFSASRTHSGAACAAAGKSERARSRAEFSNVTHPVALLNATSARISCAPWFRRKRINSVISCLVFSVLAIPCPRLRDNSNQPIAKAGQNRHGLCNRREHGDNLKHQFPAPTSFEDLSLSRANRPIRNTPAALIIFPMMESQAGSGWVVRYAPTAATPPASVVFQLVFIFGFLFRSSFFGFETRCKQAKPAKSGFSMLAQFR